MVIWMRSKMLFVSYLLRIPNELRFRLLPTCLTRKQIGASSAVAVAGLRVWVFGVVVSDGYEFSLSFIDDVSEA